MNAPTLRPEQAHAAHRAPGTAVVLAGAGSGKTTVLTARFVHLVQAHGIPVRRIAALTFTEKAASEMRERIARAIAGSDDPAVKRQAGHVEFAPISTIHAFGARLLREHAIEAGVDPAFELLDETDARLLLEDAWREVERRLRAEDDPRIAVLRRLGGDDPARGLRALHERLRGVDADLASLAWHAGDMSSEAALVDVGRALADLDAAVGESLSSKKGLAPDALRAFLEARARLPEPEGLAAGGFEPIREAARVAAYAKSMAACLPLPKGVATEARRAVFAAYEQAASALLQEHGAREVARPVRALLEELDRTYEATKRLRGVLDFGDLELRCLRLLERLERRGLRLEGAPQALLVDEYQDVNPVQARLFAHLVRAGGARAPDAFSVGDPKQSIYRFRRADVRVLEGAWDAAGEAGRTKLRESFRSTKTIVGFHGVLFASLFRERRAGVDHEPMTSMARFHDHEPVPPEFLLVDAGLRAGDARHDAEAAAVAVRIRAWIDGAEPRWKREKGADGVERPEPRPLRWRDVAVLVRARTHAKAYERAFVAAGIPFEVGRGKGFYDTEEIADLVHLLRVVHDPRDRFALAAFLASPAVGATDDDLLAVFGDDIGPAVDGEGRDVRDADATTWSRARGRRSLSAACTAIERLRRSSVAGSLEETVRAAVEVFDAFETSLLQPGGGRRARNLRKAVAIARRLDAEGGHGLFDFLRRLTDLKDREVEESEAGTGGEGDAVSLLTIHAAKGLEWPCVVLAGTNSAGPRRGGGPAFLLAQDGTSFSAQLKDPLEGLGAKPSGYRRLAAEDEKAEGEESLRLLYVALTRAEERLLISASVSGRTAKGEPARFVGWGREIWDELGAPSAVGVHRVSVQGVPVVVRVEDADPARGPVGGASWFVAHGANGLRGDATPAVEAERAGAEATWARVRAPVPHLGLTPFVVTISDLLAFARSPADFYTQRVVGAVDGARAQQHPREPADAFSGDEAGPDVDAAAAARAERWDEGREEVDGIDRAALGRAVHRALEGWIRASGDLPRLVADAVGEEFPGGVPAAVPALALSMVSRFLESPTGRAVRDAQAAARDVRPEVAFHARVRFPKGAEVAGFDSLLVKGSIDLWVTDADDRITILDHKTNAPSARFPTPEALREHYEPQLRLYALAAERVVGRDVAGAALLLLDPGWAARGVPVECPVDVSGDALERTRELCRAFAIAMKEGRFPSRWTDLG